MQRRRLSRPIKTVIAAFLVLFWVVVCCLACMWLEEWGVFTLLIAAIFLLSLREKHLG